MDITSALLKRYRRKIHDLCLNCTSSLYFKLSYFIGVPISSKCTHANQIKCEYFTPIIGIIGSTLCGLILLIGSVCELITSYNTEKRFWDLENMEAVGSFAYNISQSLVILCLTKRWKILKTSMETANSILNNASLIATESEIFDSLLLGKLILEICTILSILSVTLMSTYRYWILSRFDMFTMMTLFAWIHATMGLLMIVKMHHLLLTQIYIKLRDVLEDVANEKDDFQLLTNSSFVEAELNLIHKIRSMGYECLQNFSDYIRLAVYPYMLGNMFALSEIFCVVLLRVFYGEFFGMKDEGTFLVITSGLKCVIASYTCHVGENMAKEEELMLSYIYRYPTLKLSRKARAKIEIIIFDIRNRKYELKGAEQIVVSHKLFVQALYVSLVYTITAIQFEEMTPSMGTCKTTANCIGGFSRMYTLITQLYRTRPNPISLNAGDNFQGTLWYNMFKWNVTQFFLNMLPTDAMTLGNHEFDDGLEGIVPFLRSINIPVVLSNIDDSLEPSIRNLYRKSIIIEREGKKIGVIGVLTSGTKDVSKTGKLLFLDEVESVNSEARRLLDQEGVFTVIVVSHCGFESEIKMAKRVTRGISLIVGGHSNTLLYNGEPPIGVATGKYPTVIESVNNHTVLIIQADCFARYVGNLSVEYDASGNVISWEGNPIYLDQNIPKNESVEIHLDYYRLQINRISNRVLAKTNVLLDHASCLSSECNLGNLIADSMIAYYSNQSDKDSWSKTAVAIINSGAIRSSISKGDITLKDLQNSLPFEDKLVYGELQGKHIKTVMETCTAPYFYRKISLQLTLVQVSGLRLVLDRTKPIGSRVVSMKIRCHACEIPAYEDVDLDKYYPIAMTAYLANGGDNHQAIRNNLRNFSEGPIFIDVVSEYVEKLSPILIGLEERIIVNGSN